MIVFRGSPSGSLRSDRLTNPPNHEIQGRDQENGRSKDEGLRGARMAECSRLIKRKVGGILAVALSFSAVGVNPTVRAGGAEGDNSLNDEAIPLQFDQVPERPFALDWGTRFLKRGPTGPEIELPTGAVWQPSVIVFGTYRTAIQTFDNGQTRFSEWANRLDIFGELRLTGTERLVVGLRPFDEDGRFTSFNLHPTENDDWQTAFNVDITTLFFEGELAELFPNLDPEDTTPLDLGFSVGRQPIFIQEGMLINDTIDAVGLVRNTLMPSGTSNLRFTFLYGWHGLNRGNNFSGNNLEDDTAQLWGLFTELDTRFSTINLDLAYIDSRHTGSALYAGASAVQRIGHLNTSFRVVASLPATGETSFPRTDARRRTPPPPLPPPAGLTLLPFSPTRRPPEPIPADPRATDQNTRGVLFFGELSWTPPHTHDLVYLNGFYAKNRFSSAARDPATGGPLGRTGILFSAVGLGRYGSALSNQAEDAYGASFGYQRFLDHEHRKQLILEIGGRKDTNGVHEDQAAIGLRYQQAFGQHTLLQIDAFAGVQEEEEPSFGVRMEWAFRF
ncbi:MAG: hypothetical protein IID15_00485 [Candidatus Marinimicrobia bacterium]|nr:hypothetical protein [Candidatus Neomarinimicrobiota bacterium]